MGNAWFIVATAISIFWLLIFLYWTAKLGYRLGMMSYFFRPLRPAEIEAGTKILMDLIFSIIFLCIVVTFIERDFAIWPVLVNLVAAATLGSISYFLGTLNMKELY